jgi:hypothetical protein
LVVGSSAGKRDVAEEVGQTCLTEQNGEKFEAARKVVWGRNGLRKVADDMHVVLEEVDGRGNFQVTLVR